jgi:hypothetical protein
MCLPNEKYINILVVTNLSKMIIYNTYKIKEKESGFT